MKSITIPLIFFIVSANSCETTESTRKSKNIEFTINGTSGHSEIVYTAKELGIFASPSDYLFVQQDYSHNVDVYELGYRRYFGNSFNFKMAAFTGHFKRKIIAMERAQFDKDYYTRESDSSGINLALGNRWIYGTIIVGFDWAGFFVPLSEKNVKRHFPENVDKVKEKDLVWYYPVGYLGVSF